MTTNVAVSDAKIPTDSFTGILINSPIPCLFSSWCSIGFLAPPIFCAFDNRPVAFSAEGRLYKTVSHGVDNPHARFMIPVVGGQSCWSRGGGKLILRCPAASWKISLKLPLFIRGPRFQAPALSSIRPFLPFLAVNSIRITRARISLAVPRTWAFLHFPPISRHSHPAISPRFNSNF